MRYYDPNLGRWTQQDPVGGSLGDLNSVNRYVYADDDPVNATDPGGATSVSGSWGVFAWILYVIGSSVRLRVNSPLAGAISVVGSIVLGGIGAIVGGLLGAGAASIVLGGIGAIVGGLLGALPGLYDLFCGGKGVYFNLLPAPVTLSPAC